MALLTEPMPGDTLTDVADETTGQRIRRLRDEVLDWTQEELEEASGVSVATIYLIENDKHGKKGERVDSIRALETAIERERQRRQGENGPTVDRQIVEFLSQPAVVDSRVTRVGRGRRHRWISALVVEPGTTEEEIEAILEDMHKRRREGDPG